MRKFGSSQKDESRAQTADSSKAYRKPRAVICCKWRTMQLFSCWVRVSLVDLAFMMKQ